MMIFTGGQAEVSVRVLRQTYLLYLSIYLSRSLGITGTTKRAKKATKKTEEISKLCSFRNT